jgi:hypothetical protein
MKSSLFILFLFSFVAVSAQTEEEKLTKTMKDFHQALVKQDKALINEQTDKALTYGHSNGWVETKTDVITDLETGIISYQSFREDSIKVTINGLVAHVRFIADIDATLRGNKSSHHLKVLEVWVKRKDQWFLFARQAIK